MLQTNDGKSFLYTIWLQRIILFHQFTNIAGEEKLLAKAGLLEDGAEDDVEGGNAHASMALCSLLRDFGMLHGERQVFLREVEHVENDGLRAAVLAVVDGVYHLDDGLTLMHRFLLAVLTDDG